MISKGPQFSLRDIYIDYDFERVMFRWCCDEKKIYRKFYGELEEIKSIPHDSHLYNEALRFGNEITKQEYLKGKI